MSARAARSSSRPVSADRLARLDELDRGRAIASFSGGWRCDLASKPGSSALALAGAVAPPCTFSTSPASASASRSRRIVISDTCEPLGQLADAHRAGRRTLRGSASAVDRRASSRGTPGSARYRFHQYPTRSRRSQAGAKKRRSPNLDTLPAAHERVSWRCIIDRSGSVVFESDRVSEQGGSHVGSIASCDRPEGGREPDLEPPQALRRRPRRCGRRSTASRPAAVPHESSPALRGALAAGTVTFGSNGSDPVPKKAYANVFKAFTKKTGIDVKVNTVDHNTFQEQINSYLQGQPAGRVHVVRRLPDAVLRGQGPAPPHRRRLGAAQAAVRIGAPERVEGRSTGTTTSCPIYDYPVGGALPQERVQAERLQGPEDLGPVRRARQEDEGRRADADRLHATRTAGPRWGPSTSSTCGSTATTSTSA